MKKILPLLLVAILIVACSKIEQPTYFRIESQNLELDARCIDNIAILHINTNLSDWDYYTQEADWLTIKKESQNCLYISVNKANTTKNERRAEIIFNVNSADYKDNYLSVTQLGFYYTEKEQQMIDASDIVKKVYNNVNIEIDIDTLISTCNYFSTYDYSSKGTGRFRYSSSNYSANIPITFSVLKFTDTFQNYTYHYVYLTIPEDYSQYPRVFGRIYTGYNSDGHNKGDFDLTLYEDGVTIKFTQDGN